MLSIYILLLIQIVLYTLNPFFKKLGSKNISYNKFVTFYQIIGVTISIFHIVYLLKFKNVNVSELFKLDKKDILYIFLAVLTGFLGSILFLYIVKLDDLSYIIPNIQGIVILLNMFISYFFLKESMSTNKCLGTLLIFTGIIVLNYKHYNYLKDR